MANKYEQQIGYANYLNNPDPDYSSQVTLFPAHQAGSPLCELFLFSDSIILVSSDDQPINVLKLLIYAWRLSQTFMVSGMPLRGGISFGELYTNPSRNICLGNALTSAFELEKKQDWIGVALDNSITEKFPMLFIGILNDVFFEYPVPLKNDEVLLSRTLNWRFNLIVKNGTRSLFPSHSDPKVKIKVHNTLEYSKAVIESGRIYVKDQKDLPIELRSFWVGDSEPPFSHGDDL